MKNRKEWDYVGIVGVLPSRCDESCIAGEYCKCGREKTAVFAINSDFVHIW